MTFLIKIKDYFRDAIREMKKVSWPNKKQTKNYSLLVIALSVGTAIFFGVLDYILNLGLGLIV